MKYNVLFFCFAARVATTLERRLRSIAVFLQGCGNLRLGQGRKAGDDVP